ncbi:hypothetical protein K2224_37285 (plasmid) [Streptomyces sp. BHT-5-2]|uniref:ATP dependent DNA ligase n=1 Tax=Streptomyces sp. BHT-5-2 TaxID=2866715 RepID=UPI001C8E0A96|nr:hypothetical protein [Streptomyces sp. BHT-5-2]QZL08708.1 hypothetical protein K2224_37285 [Streptomyces sp. BHT-5-2]
MTGFLDRLPRQQRQPLRRAPRDRSAGPPMPAVLGDRRAFGDGWLFERRLDGVRAPAIRDGGEVRLSSRSGKSLNATSPELVDTLTAQDCGAKRTEGTCVHLRSAGWLRLKCSAGQEFVIGRFTEPAGSRVGFGALLVGQITFTEWTRAGRLRHPRFLGLRDDKRAVDVVREEPAGGAP